MGLAYASSTGIFQDAQSAQFVSAIVLNGGLIDVVAEASANGDRAVAEAQALGIGQDVWGADGTSQVALASVDNSGTIAVAATANAVGETFAGIGFSVEGAATATGISQNIGAVSGVASALGRQ